MTANCPIPVIAVGSRRTTARVTPGAISLSNSSHFALKSYSNSKKPVALPPGCDVFGAGWSRRVAEVKAFSLHLADHPIAAQAPVPRPVPSEAAPAKGVVPPPKALKDTIIKGAPVGGAAGGVGFWDWVAAHPNETASIILIGASAIGGAIYALNRWHQARQEAPTPGLIPIAA